MSCSRTTAATRRTSRAVTCLFLIAVVVGALLGAAAVATAATAPTFTRADYASNVNPSWVEPVDVTGDGLLDLVVSGEGDDSVIVFTGDGKGGFSLPLSFPSGGDGPYSCCVAELTGDGRLDVAVVNRWSKTVTLLVGDGTGAFFYARSMAVGTEATDVKAIDLDEDGDLDLVSCNMWTTNLNLLLNDGTGVFTRKDVALPNKGATVMGVGDVNGDGHDDVALGHYWGTTATVLLGDGKGSLVVTTSLPVGPYPTGAVFDDFNKDGKTDVAVASRYPNNANIYLGNGAGGFGPATTYTIGPFAKVLDSADLNLDGTLDLAICNWGAASNIEKTVSILSGHGDGLFDSEVRVQVGSKPHSVAIADLNRDGKPDVVTPNYASQSVTVLLNTTPVTVVDVTPPVTTTSADGAWHRGEVAVTFSATDAQSGVAYTEFQVAGGGWQTGTGFLISGEGVHTVEYRSVDNAGNVEDVRTAQVKIDDTAPALTVLSPTAGASYVQGSNVIADWTASDGLSGVALQAATVDGTPIAKGARIDMLAAGAHTLVVTITDAAGNQTSNSVPFTITSVPGTLGLALVWPLGGEQVLQGSTQTIRWSLATPVATGSFKIWLKTASGSLTQLASGIAAVAGQTSYSRTWVVTQAPVAAGAIRVSYYNSSGVYVTKAENPISVLSTLPTLTWPTGGETVVQGRTYTVSWTIPNAVTQGRYRIWLRNAAGTYVQITPAAIYAVPGQKLYSWSWTVTQPPVTNGALRLRYYSDSGTTIHTVEKTISVATS